MGQSSVEILSEFIDTAVKNRRYPSNTAAGLRSALRVFGSELNETERASVEELSKNLDSLYRQVASRNHQNMTSASMETYHRRMKNLLGDYENYGVDPVRMAAWSRPTRTIRTREPGSVLPNHPTGSLAIPTVTPQEVPGTSRLEVALRPDVKAILLLPADLTPEDAVALKALVDASVRSTR